MKMRADALDARTMSDPKLYEEKLQLAREIAKVLRTNIVQGVKIKEAEDGLGPDLWSYFFP
jgi:peptide chain release factor